MKRYRIYRNGREIATTTAMSARGALILMRESNFAELEVMVGGLWCHWL